MARIRTIKPSFFKNEDLAELPMGARLLFIGLWCLCDKEGRMEDRPKRIKAEIFPYDSIDIDQQLSRLQSAGFILRYSTSAITEVGEMKVIQIINFSKHQRITGSEVDTESEYQAPDLTGGNTLETLWKQKGNTLDDRKGKEGKGNGKEWKGEARDPENFSVKNEKENTGLPGAEISMPFAEGFKLMWDQWKIYKSKEFSFKYKSTQSEQASINELVHLANGIELTAVEIIKQSMAKRWKGFFELKNVKNEPGSSSKGKVTGADLNQAFAKRYPHG